jgi:hypothetical protein
MYFYGHMFNPSLKMGTNVLFITTHLDEECGNQARANTYTIRNI